MKCAVSTLIHESASGRTDFEEAAEANAAQPPRARTPIAERSRRMSRAMIPMLPGTPSVLSGKIRSPAAGSDVAPRALPQERFGLRVPLRAVGRGPTKDQVARGSDFVHAFDRGRVRRVEDDPGIFLDLSRDGAHRLNECIEARLSLGL